MLKFHLISPSKGLRWLAIFSALLVGFNVQAQPVGIFVEPVSNPSAKRLFEVGFKPPSGFRGSTQLAEKMGAKLEFRKGFGADQATLILMPIPPSAGASEQAQAQQCLAERFPGAVADRKAVRVEMGDRVAVGAGVKTQLIGRHVRADVLYACIARPFGAVAAVYIEPKLRGEPSEMRSVISALGKMSLTERAPANPTPNSDSANTIPN